MRKPISPSLVLAGVIGTAAAVHTLQRRRHHQQNLELGLHQTHARILQVAVTHPDLDPVWVRNFPAYVKPEESGALLMCQWWLEHWRNGLNVGAFTASLLRQNAEHFIADPLALKAWALTRHSRAQQARNNADRLHVSLLNSAYVEAGGPELYPDLELFAPGDPRRAE